MDMTQERWNRMTPRERDAVRSLAGLTDQLIGLEGRRVEVVDFDDETRRFWVSRSSGWRPCHIEVLRVSSTGGFPADRRGYKSVRVVKASRS